MWPTDLGKMIDSELTGSLGDAAYGKVKDRAHAQYGNAKNIKKNPMLIGAKLALAVEAGGTSATMNKLCDEIVGFDKR